MLTWNVYIGDMNDKRIETYNVFDHWSFWHDCVRNRKKNAVRGREDKDAFVDQLILDLKYYYWSKCEWEIVLSHWPPSDRMRSEKVDVYDQLLLNWDRFVDYVWDHRKEFKEKKE